jgi:hypothetical protein
MRDIVVRAVAPVQNLVARSVIGYRV